MIPAPGNNSVAQTTSWKVVLPFYGYAALAFFTATLLLLLSATEVTRHYFHPHTLAITHMMALGWGTMVIMGAGHQLVPVLIEGKLYSNVLAYACFILAAIGIPLLVFGLFYFDMGWPATTGGSLIVMAVLLYMINLATSMSRSKHENVHAVFVFTSFAWLLATVTLGLLQVFNFTTPILPRNSLDYLPLHAHMGIAGWFLLLVIGVGSRLIPMFLISKYNNPRLLWVIYLAINGGLLSFVFIFLYSEDRSLLLIPLLAVAAGIILFGHYCFKAYGERIRKRVDEQMKISLLSVMMMILPLVFLGVIIIMILLSENENMALLISYGFIIFFGWLTAIILGMTFKTLPFIVWNRRYHLLAGKGRTPNPKDLFSAEIFKWMCVAYIAGFLVFTGGILSGTDILLRGGAALLLISSLLYNWNVFILLLHKPALS